MTTDNTEDILNLDESQKPKLPSGLNVLTILTFVGCGLGAIFTLLTPMIFKFSTNMMEKAMQSGQDISPKQLADMEKAMAAMELSKQNMIPLMVVGVIGIILCFVGALWMRKLKKDGYWLYVAGEFAPVITSLVLLGTAQFTGVTSVILTLFIPVLFVTLYTLQRKHLVN